MNSYPENQKANIAGTDTSGERTQLELVVDDPAAISITVEGLGSNPFGSLPMTQTTNGVWLVRLCLAPGIHTVSVSLRRGATHAKELDPVRQHWRTEFEVPPINHSVHLKADLRIRLHEGSNQRSGTSRINTS